MIRQTVFLALPVVVLAACSRAVSVSSQSIERGIVEACETLVTEYAIYRDRPDPGNYANTFTEDGELVLPTGTYRGRGELRTRLAATAGKITTRHMMATTRITVTDFRNATGISYAMIFAADTPESSETAFPVAVERLAAIGEYHDSFRLTDQGWKFARREFRPVFDWKVDATPP